MRTIIAGSRHGITYFDTLDAIKASNWADEISVVLSGLAEGPDLHGKLWAEHNGTPVEPYPAIWRPNGKYDPEAGFKRNQEMADKAEALIAVWDGKSGGTADMIKRARKANLRIFVWNLLEPVTTFRF